VEKVANFAEIFERIKLATNTRTQMEVADALEIRQSSISDAKRRNSVPAEWYMKLFESFGLSPDWLKKGAGPMFLRTDQGYAPVDGPSEGGTRGMFKNSGQYSEPDAESTVVPVYSPLEAYNAEAPAHSAGRLNIPTSFAHPGLYVIRVEASSMEPGIRRGAYVSLDTTQRAVISGDLYGVNLAYEGVAIKRVYLDAPNSRCILRSENPSHPEMTIPIDSGGQSFIVGRVAWVLQKM
jgi:phage repressor protein C with HTH and peptisase S24 domain